MTVEAQVLTIDSEEKAYEMLQRALEGEYDDQFFQLQFDGWPKLRIVYRGDNYEGELPARVMKSFVELQDSVNRIYADFVYDGKLSKLKDSDRNEIELFFKIDHGSVEVNINFDKFLQKLGEATMQPENFKKLMVTLGVVAVTAGGYYGFDRYQDSQDLIAQYEHQENMDHQENQRLKLVVDALTEAPETKKSVNKLIKAQKKTVISAYDADEVEMDGKIYSQDVIAEFAQKTRTATEAHTSRMTFIVDGIKSKKPNKPVKTVTLIEKETGKVYATSFNKNDEELFLRADVDRLYEAFRNDSYIELDLEVKRKPSGAITSSKIVKIWNVVPE